MMLLRLKKLFFFMHLRPPTSTLFPYTTLFRSFFGMARTQPGCCSSTRSCCFHQERVELQDRKSTRLNSSHVRISYAVFCLKKKKSYEILRVARITGMVLCIINSSTNLVCTDYN